MILNQDPDLDPDPRTIKKTRKKRPKKVADPIPLNLNPTSPNLDPKATQKKEKDPNLIDHYDLCFCILLVSGLI